MWVHTFPTLRRKDIDHRVKFSDQWWSLSRWERRTNESDFVLLFWKDRIVIFDRKSTWLAPSLLSSLHSMAVKWTEPDDVGHLRHNLKAFPVLIERNKWKKPNWFVVPLLTFTARFGVHLPFDIDHNSKSLFLSDVFLIMDTSMSSHSTW